MTLWSARVGSALAPEVWEFLKADDWELLPYDCRATLLHAERLHAAGLLTDDELSEVVHGPRLGANDDIVGTGDVLRGFHALDPADFLCDLSGSSDLGLDQDVRVDHVPSPGSVVPVS